MEGKRPLCHDRCKLIMLDGFDLGVLGELGELGASRFPGPERVRAKDAKVRKRRSVSCSLIIRVGGRVGWRGTPGSVSPATTDGSEGGLRAEGGDWGLGNFDC